MAIMLRKQNHHIGNKCTSSPASMSVFTSNIQATQSTSALQQQPRQPRHVEYALQPNTTAPHQVHSQPHNKAAHHFTISQPSLSTSSSLPPCPINPCLRSYMCLGRGTAITTTTRAVPHHPEGDMRITLGDDVSPPYRPCSSNHLSNKATGQMDSHCCKRQGGSISPGGRHAHHPGSASGSPPCRTKCTTTCMLSHGAHSQRKTASASETSPLGHCCS